MNSTQTDDELAVKGLAALSLTKTESEASTFQLPSGPLKATFEIAKVDVETFYERIRQARSVHCRHSQH